MLDVHPVKTFDYYECLDVFNTSLDGDGRILAVEE
jgi:hypothetical protein